MVCVMTDELYHHGIKGQKWGIRRYQNPDGSYTEAGKKRYLNPDGSLNYRGIQKQRKDAIDKDPYGKTKKEGGPGRSKDQSQRLARDNALYGQKGVTRIKDKMSTGQTYSKAKRAESIRAGAKTAAIVLAYGVTMDYLLTGGTATKAVARGIAAEGKYALQYGEFTAKKLMNNMAGIVIGDLGIGRQKFDDYAMRQVFGNN